MKLKSFLLLFIFLALSCDQSEWKPYFDGSYMLPKTVTITSDRPLVVTELAAGTGYTTNTVHIPADTASTIPVTPSPATINTTPYPIMLVDLVATGTGIGKDGTGQTAEDSTLATFTANITVTTSPIPAGTVLGAVIAAPYSSLITDFVATFTITNADIISNQFLKFSVYAKNGDPGTFRKSNAIPTTRYKVTQITNTRTTASDQSSSFNTTALIPMGDRLVFIANTAQGYDLVSYNSAAPTPGVDQLSNTLSGASDMDYNKNYLYHYNNKLYFRSAIANNISKLFVYDESASSIRQLSDINGPATDDTPVYYLGYDNKVFFQANSLGFSKAFYYDTALDEIRQLPETWSSNNEQPNFKIVYKNKIYYTSRIAGDLEKLFSFDGTTVRQVTDTAGAFSDFPTNFTILNDILYFTARDSSGLTANKLFSFDGSTVRQISNLKGLGNTDFSSTQLIGYNGKLYFRGNDNSVPAPLIKLFQYNPQTNSIIQISNVVSGSDDNCFGLTVYDGKLLVETEISTGVRKVLVYNEETNKLVQLLNTTGSLSATDFTPGSPTAAAFHPVKFDNKMFFVANNAAINKKVFYYDFSTNELVQASNTNPTGADDPFNLFVFKDKLYFWSKNSSANTKLYSFERI